MKVTKAIIPAAGRAGRFLPANTGVRKEMLSIVNKPAIQYVVEEAVASGIEEIVLVTGRGDRAVEDHFDNISEFGSKSVNIQFVRQKEPKGLGHAIWCARHFIGDEPFAVLLADEIIKSDKPCLKQLLEHFDHYRSSIIGVKKVDADEVSRYGIVEAGECRGNLLEVKQLVEKPRREEAPSDLAIVGRYVLTPEIMDILGQQSPGVDMEIQLTDALALLNQYERVMAYRIDDPRYDIGQQFGYIRTAIDFSLARQDLREPLLGYLNTVVAPVENR